VVESAGELAADGSMPIVLTLPLRTPSSAVVVGTRTVPDVRGVPLRRAALELHQAGFRVQLVDGGTAGETAPAAGATARAGDVIRLRRGS
jgi:beta-lactam-binding protein with PASTA domain